MRIMKHDAEKSGKFGGPIYFQERIIEIITKIKYILRNY